MNLEDTLTRSLHDHLDRVETPRVDIESVRRAGDRRRATTSAATGLAVLALVAGGVALTTVGGEEDRVVQPAGLPAMEFDQGLRAFYDEGSGLLHMGGARFEISQVASLDTRASATPGGVVWVDGEQAVRRLTEDGDVERLAPPVEDGLSIYANVKYDAVTGDVGWLVRDTDGVRLVVGSDGDQLTVDVPCEGDACQMLALGGLDSGLVFVRRVDERQTLVLDRADPDGGWTTIDGFRVGDVRNQVVLGDGTLPSGGVLGDGWRFVEGEGVESLLTFDGAHELYWSSTLRSTDGGEPLRLDLPKHRGVEFVNLDSDGSVLVAVMTNNSTTYYDCDVSTRACEEFAQLGPAAGDPIFLGNDM